MNKEEILEIIEKSIEKSAGYNVPLAVHLHFYPGSEQPVVETNPSQEPDRKAYIIITDKQSNKVKLRSSPSPAVDGPVVPEGTLVYATGNEQKAYGKRWVEVVTTTDLRGWVEDTELKEK